MSVWGLLKRRSALPYVPLWLGKYFSLAFKIKNKLFLFRMTVGWQVRVIVNNNSSNTTKLITQNWRFDLNQRRSSEEADTQFFQPNESVHQKSELSPVSTTRVHGPSSRPVNSGAFLTSVNSGRQLGSKKCTRVHGSSTRAVNSGNGNRALVWRTAESVTCECVCDVEQTTVSCGDRTRSCAARSTGRLVNSRNSATEWCSRVSCTIRWDNDCLRWTIKHSSHHYRFRCCHAVTNVSFLLLPTLLNSTWPHLNSDVGLEEGKY